MFQSGQRAINQSDIPTDLRISVREKTVLRLFHPDAVELFNVSSDLKRVCWTLADPKFRLPKKVGQRFPVIGERNWSKAESWCNRQSHRKPKSTCSAPSCLNCARGQPVRT
jgi:hypothetical protein